MKRRTRTTCLAFTLGALSLLARGQNLAPLSPPPTVQQAAGEQSNLPELTLEEAIEHAIANNSSLKTASLDTLRPNHRNRCDYDLRHRSGLDGGLENLGFLCSGRREWIIGTRARPISIPSRVGVLLGEGSGMLTTIGGLDSRGMAIPLFDGKHGQIVACSGV